MFLNSNLAAYNSACTNRIMTFSTLPGIITNNNKVLSITPTAIGTSTFTVTYNDTAGNAKS